MKRLITDWLPALAGLCLFGAAACSDRNEYLKYTGGHPRPYTGRVDSVRFRSGDERIVFNGLLMSDPKIAEVKIYWNSRADSLTLAVERTAGIDTLCESLPLPEGRYNFEVYSYDAEGNPSVPVNASGVSYGDDYKASLYNRPVKRVEKAGDDVVIDWYNGDETSPFVRIDYTDTQHRTHRVNVPVTEKQTILKDYRSMSRFTLQTYYLPDPEAIDTFRAEVFTYSVNEDITGRYVKNPGNPFVRGDDGTGKWGLPKDWSYTPDIVNQEGSTKGGWSTDSGGVIHFESKDWGGEGVTNGKIYQTVTLPAGRYSLEFYSDGGGGDFTEGNFMVAAGNALPDVGRTGEALAFAVWDRDHIGGTRTIRFMLDREQTVTFGWAVSFGSNTWMHINWVKLMSLAE